MPLDKSWFTEKAPEIGTAFSLAIKNKLHEEQTPYQLLQIFDTKKFGHLMVLDGFIMLSQRDNFIYHEMMVHPALFSHPDPKNVVIIGGGDCGTLQQVLKHDGVISVTQIEIDEKVTTNAKTYFPELCENNGDPRARLLFEDGIAWVEKANANSIDIIIVDSTDPIGPAEGLFSEPFYRACHTALKEDGLIVQQSESPLAHANSITYPMHTAMRSAGFTDTNSLFFPLPVYPTGWWSATIGGKSAITFGREHIAAKKPFMTRYYNVAIHKAAFATPEFFKEGLIK